MSALPRGISFIEPLPVSSLLQRRIREDCGIGGGDGETARVDHISPNPRPTAIPRSMTATRI